MLDSNQGNMHTKSLIWLFVVLMLVPYAVLVTYFDFPNILREAPADIMLKFKQSQSKVVFGYYLFTLSQIVFSGVVISLFCTYRKSVSDTLIFATFFGFIAGILQAIGFSRWPFAVPKIAETVSSPTVDQLTKDSAINDLATLHNFGGVAIGENLFFVCESIWAITFGLFLLSHKQLSPWFGRSFITCGILVAIYSLEQFGGVFSILGPINVVAHAGIVFTLLGLSFTVEKVGYRLSRIQLTLCWALFLLISASSLV